jgi:hypothetical protein
MLQPVSEFFSLDDFAVEAQYIPPAASAIGLNFQVAGTTEIPLRNGAADNVELGCKWTQAAESSLKHVYLMLKRSGTIAAGKKIWIRLVGNSGGSPDSLVLAASAALEAADIGTSYTWVKFTFPQEVKLEAGTVYHIVLSGNYEVSTSNHIRWRSKTVASGGNQEVYDSSWAAVATENFEIYGSIHVIFDDAAQITDVMGIQYENAAAIATCKSADVSDANEGAAMSIAGVTYKVIQMQPDGTGITRLVLSVHAADS